MKPNYSLDNIIKRSHLKHKKETIQQKLERPLTHEELQHAITFLFSSNVINSNEATTIYTKALPFTKG